MTWFTENPWPLMILLGLAAIIFGAFWSTQKRSIWLLAATIALGVAAGVYFIAHSIVTEAERVELNIRSLTQAFSNKDREVTLSFFSPRATELRQTCDAAFSWVDFPQGIDVKDVSIKLSNENTRAISRFRANGTVAARGMGSQHFASRWEFTWQKEAGQWKIVGVQRLNPFKEEKMEFMDPRQN